MNTNTPENNIENASDFVLEKLIEDVTEVYDKWIAVYLDEDKIDPVTEEQDLEIRKEFMIDILKTYITFMNNHKKYVEQQK